jgi:ferric-dicitrate binding protein FerR (iron transport regulator)
MKENSYNNVEDFINDPSFVSFVFKTNEKNIAEWQDWLFAHPHKKELAEESANILRLFQIKEKPVSNHQLSAAELRLRAAMDAESRSSKIIGIRKKIFYWSAAAVVLISLAFGLTFLFPGHQEKYDLATNYGQVKKDKLPDGTEVILNAHSHIILGKKWEEGSSREVWMKGEAFFHVKKTAHHDKFIVHTDAFDIEVTGTSFNVINNEHKSSVVLKEGSVKIHRPGEPDILMKPGDAVEFANSQIKKKKIVKDDYLAWTNNKLVFDNTSLTEVARTIESHYGINVKLQGDGIEGKTITGIMPNDNLDVLLDAMEATQEFDIQKDKDLITITNTKTLIHQ